MRVSNVSTIARILSLFTRMTDSAGCEGVACMTCEDVLLPPDVSLTLQY